MNHTAQFSLDPGGVSACLSFLEQTLTAMRLGRRDLMEALLISEEVMLLMDGHAPETAALQVTVTRKLGIPRICMTAAGTPMSLDDHIGDISLEQLGEDAESVIRGIMLRSYADSLRYRHSRGRNVVTIVTGIPERILAGQTLSAIFLALVSGLLLRSFLPQETIAWLVDNIFSPTQELFISALMCITAPAVFVSITCSTFRFEGFSELGNQGRTVIALYLVTSVLATLVGMASFQIFTPGAVGVLAPLAGGSLAENFSLLTILTSLIPHNVIEPFISVNSIQLMITALTIGTGITMSGKRVLHLKTMLEEMDVLCGKISSLVMQAVPFVVFCSTASVVFTYQTALLRSGLQLVITLLAGLAAMVLLYCGILLLCADLNPLTFLKKYGPTMKNTFLKGSGVAAIPMTMRTCRRQLGIPQSICSFSIPLGATINMDGNCVCLTITSLFFLRTCGLSLDANGLVILLLLVLILSLGAPIAPGTLILCLVTLLTQMGIDTNVLSLVIGMNFILEMLLGMVNSTGDVVVALITAQREGTLDQQLYNK